jgi:hypothetical protein
MIGDFGSARAVEPGLAQSRVAQSTLPHCTRDPRGPCRDNRVILTYLVLVWAHGLILRGPDWTFGIRCHSAAGSAFAADEFGRRSHGPRRQQVLSCGRSSRGAGADPAKRPTAGEVCGMLSGVKVTVIDGAEMAWQCHHGTAEGVHEALPGGPDGAEP